MHNLIEDMKALSVQNRTVAIMENGTWAPAAGRLMVKELEEMKNMNILDMKLAIKSALHNDRETELDTFVQQIVDAM
jgi:flavorubredoxin